MSIGKLALILVLASFAVCFAAMAARVHADWVLAPLSLGFVSGVVWFFSGYPEPRRPR